MNTNSFPDDYPVRPNTVVKVEESEETTKKSYVRVFVLLGITYFLHGSGSSIYGPLYSREAHSKHIASNVYGSVLSVSFLVAAVFSPVAYRMVALIACKQSFSMGVFIVGVCRILFGVLVLTSSKTWFISLSFAIQAVEGVGTSLLVASTYVTVFSHNDQASKHLKGINILLCLGITLGSIYGEAVKNAFGVSVPFYGIGVLTVLDGICIAALLPEPSRKTTLVGVPVFSWIQEKRMLLYLLIIFCTFHYFGFLSVTLEPMLHQFNLDPLTIGLIFAINPFAYILGFYFWTWITKIGFNTILLICIGSILTFTSIVFIGPAPFLKMETSLRNVLIAVVLNGVGSGGKIACSFYAAEKDLRWVADMQPVDHILIGTIFSFGSILGYFSGSFVVGFSEYYLGLKNSTYVLFGLEVLTFIPAFLYAFKRNYRSDKHREKVEESSPILAR